MQLIHSRQWPRFRLSWKRAAAAAAAAAAQPAPKQPAPKRLPRQPLVRHHGAMPLSQFSLHHRSNTCWAEYATTNLVKMPRPKDQWREQCELRHGTLHAVQQACERLTACGGVSRDNGLHCQQKRMPFELRGHEHRQLHSSATRSWLIVRNATPSMCNAQQSVLSTVHGRRNSSRINAGRHDTSRAPPVSFLHIPKNGGSAIEEHGRRIGLHWARYAPAFQTPSSIRYSSSFRLGRKRPTNSSALPHSFCPPSFCQQ